MPAAPGGEWLWQSRNHFRSFLHTKSASRSEIRQCLQESFSFLPSFHFWLKTSSNYGERKAFLGLEATHSSGREGRAQVSEGLCVVVLGLPDFPSCEPTGKPHCSRWKRTTLTAQEQGSEPGLCLLECHSSRDFFNH